MAFAALALLLCRGKLAMLGLGLQLRAGPRRWIGKLERVVKVALGFVGCIGGGSRDKDGRAERLKAEAWTCPMRHEIGTSGMRQRTCAPSLAGCLAGTARRVRARTRDLSACSAEQSQAASACRWATQRSVRRGARP